MMRLLPLLACCILSQAVAAQPVYKCTTGGKTSYGDRPCTDGPSTVLPPVAGGIRPEGAETEPTQDARLLLTLEKERMQREQEKTREEAREAARADRSHARNVKAEAAQRKQCDRLRLRARWADEDLARARGKTRGKDVERARIKAKRARETMAVECPA